MGTAAGLPLPGVSCGRFAFSLPGDAHAPHVPNGKEGEGGWISAYTDEALFRACGVRIAFTQREGGFSPKPYDSLNLKEGLGDSSLAVARNRSALLAALGAGSRPVEVVCPLQVHGTDITEILSLQDLAQAGAGQSGRFGGGQAPCSGSDARVQEADGRKEGSDAALVSIADVAALLCFADCLPLIVVAPTGAFAVAHCGWKGTVAHLARKACMRLAKASGCEPVSFNAYIGAYIHEECFEVSEDVASRFSEEFSPEVASFSQAAQRWHVNLGAAVAHDLLACGVSAERIADVGQCTACNEDSFFSYRASGGTCGRHGALAVRFVDSEDAIGHR